MNKKLILAFCIVFLVMGCEEVEPAVKWANYSPQVKERIGLYLKNKDCAALQKEFDAAADNSDQQRRRTGEGNLSLMEYIIYHGKNVGC
ncbi:MAG: hypothetical protein GY820_03830 [Gammaproteobacteria bacterium]|nr:hypothetical protein [Gammaproteobacteria bacterium]